MNQPQVIIQSNAEKAGENMCFDAMRMREAVKYIGKDEILFIDLRNKKEYAGGHIPGAKNFPYDDTEDMLDWSQNVKKMVGLYEQKKNIRVRRILLYCDRGNMSLMAARDLSRISGNICNLFGGYLSYRGPIERTYVN